MRSLPLLVVVAACSGPARPASVPAAPSSSPPPSDHVVAAPVPHDAVLPPELDQAFAQLDPRNAPSVEAAVKAADQVAAHGIAAAIDRLAWIALEPASQELLPAQIAAIRALGALAGARDRAARPLLGIVSRDVPDLDKQPLELALTGAAINALADLRPPAAIAALVLEMYRVPVLFDQARRALFVGGATTVEVLRKVLRGDDAAVNHLFALHHLDKVCVDPDSCVPVSARDFYAAVVLGDLGDPRALPELFAALQHPALPSYYVDTEPGTTTQHDAIFDAIRRIGAAGSAKPLHALWADPHGDLSTRIHAVAAFPFVSRDATGIDELGQIAADNTADDQLRQEAATAYARLATTGDAITLLGELAKRYLDASAKKQREAKQKQPAAAAADAAFGKAKVALDKAKTTALAVAHNPGATVQQLQAATKAAAAAEVSFDHAKRTHRDQTAPFRQTEAAAKAYLGYARMFQTHVARVELAMRCAGEAGCLVASLSASRADAAKAVARYVTDIATWTDDEKQQLVEAAAERGMIELTRQGPASPAVKAALLAALREDHRPLFPSIVYALKRIVAPPCAECVAALAVDPGIDARLARLYFARR